MHEGDGDQINSVAAAEAAVPLEWAVGDVILDLYEVMEILRGGGMGLVYRVHHRGWNTELAVKSPRTEFFRSEVQKENFVRECEAWMELGLHPHVVSCHYVRTLGGVPRVFAEYVEGGSLADWITNRRLYEGGPERALERILDIAIQMGRGLGYAHERGLIHQDVKPANVLMMSDGTAKITDFGLARARGVTAESAVGDSGWSILASCGGMTPAYCSPEQAALGAGGGAGMSADVLPKLTRRTDIWSWAVSVLEMFLGEPPCQHGQVAGQSFEQYLECADQLDASLPQMPNSLMEVLRQCLRTDETERPRNFGDVLGHVLDIYRSIGAKDYSRPNSSSVDLLADALNNRAVSMLDLGKREDAEKVFEEALKIDANHPNAAFNLGIIRWRSGRITDADLVAQLQGIREILQPDLRAEHFLGLIHMERGDFESAVAVLEHALKLGAQAEVRGMLNRARAFAQASSQNAPVPWTRKNGFRCCGLSTDARWAASGGDDTAIQLWDLATGQYVRAFDESSTGIDAVCFSADGSRALGEFDDRTLGLWDTGTGQCLQRFEGHTDAFASMCLSPDGRWAGSGSIDEALRLWDAHTGRLIRTVDNTAGVTSVCFSSDGRWALSGNLDNTLRLWDVCTGRCLQTFEGHADGIESVCMSADGHLVLSGSMDRTLRLWDVSSGRCLWTAKGHTGAVRSVCLSAGGRWALSGSEDRTLRLWDLTTSQCIRTFEGHKADVTWAALSADCRWGVSGSNDRTLRLWDLSALASGRQKPEPPSQLCVVIRSEELAERAGRFGHLLKDAEGLLLRGNYQEASLFLRQARLIPGYERDTRALQGSNEGQRNGVRVDLCAAWCARAFEGHSGGVSAVCLSADGRLALSGSKDSTYRMWDVRTGNCLFTFKGDAAPVRAVCLSSDGRWAMASSAGRLRLWEVSTGRCVRESFCGVSSLCFSPDGRWALFGAPGYTLSLWEVSTGRKTQIFKGHIKSVQSGCFSVDGRWVLSGGMDSILRLWDVATGRCVRTLKGLEFGVTAVCVSEDGRRALSGSIDRSLRNTVWLWDVSTGQRIREFEGHTRRITSLSFSADGRWAGSSSDDHTLRLWEVSTGRCVRVLVGHAARVTSMCFSTDGRWMLSGGLDNKIRLWELDWVCEFPDPADWDEGARPYLETFLVLRCPVGEDGISRVGKPAWTEEDFARLIADLQIRGYGWLRPEGVRRQLEEMTAEWQGPPSIVEGETS